MSAKRSRTAAALHPISTIVPSALLALTPLFDLVRMVTRSPFWSRAAFWSAVAAALVVIVAFLSELADWLTVGRRARARVAGAAPLTLHLAAIAPLSLGIFERLHLAATAWPMALAIAGALAWLVAAWMSEERIEERVRYQPTGFPSKA